MKFNDLTEKGQHMLVVKDLLKKKDWDSVMVMLSGMMNKYPDDDEIKKIYSEINSSKEYQEHLDSDSGELPF